MIMQLITFLYQNSEVFFVVSHTETFVVSLFSTLILTQNQPNSPQTHSSSNIKGFFFNYTILCTK